MKSARSFLSVNTVFFYFWYKVSSVFGLFQETGCFSIRVFATAFGYQDKPKYHPHNMSQKHKKRILLCERPAFLFGKRIRKIDRPKKNIVIKLSNYY